MYPLLLSAALALSTGSIKNPVINTLVSGSAQEKCFAGEIRKQAPSGLFASGDLYVMGPNARRDVAPAGSVIEIMGAAPNAKPFPRYVSLSVWFETPDQSLWSEKALPDASFEYRASAVLNPAKVFDRVRYKFLFDLDLTPCLETAN